MADVAHEDSVLPRPVQEEGDQKTAETVLKLLKDLLQSNPDVLNQVQSLKREKVKGRKLQAITSFLLAAASGSYSGASFIFVLLWNTLLGVVKMKREIPRERHAQLDEIKSSLEEVETKQKKVQHDTGKMEEKIQTATENDFKISCNDNKKLEIGLIDAWCDLESCQDILSCVRDDAIKGLQLRAKEAIASAKILVITLVVVAALAAGFLHHWSGLAKEHSRGDRFDNDDDEDVTWKGSIMTSFMVMGCLIMTVIILAICKQNAQSWINNRKLLAECEVLQENGLQKAELFQKHLKRDVEYKLPNWKKQLAVLDIDVSLYASLHSHSE